MAHPALLPVVLTCNTDLRFIDLIQVVGAEFLKHLSFSQEDGERLWLAIQEGIANAMRHGNQLQKDKPVKVTFTPRADRFEIRIEDRGPGIDLDTLADPNLPENLLKPGGRGPGVPHREGRSPDAPRRAKRRFHWRLRVPPLIRTSAP